jgi:hypothetical protein
MPNPVTLTSRCRFRSCYRAHTRSVTAAATNGANIIHPADAASITAPSFCHGPRISAFVTESGFAGGQQAVAGGCAERSKRHDRGQEHHHPWKLQGLTQLMRPLPRSLPGTSFVSSRFHLLAVPGSPDRSCLSCPPWPRRATGARLLCRYLAVSFAITVVAARGARIVTPGSTFHLHSRLPIIAYLPAGVLRHRPSIPSPVPYPRLGRGLLGAASVLLPIHLLHAHFT